MACIISYFLDLPEPHGIRSIFDALYAIEFFEPSLGFLAFGVSHANSYLFFP